MPLLKYYDYFYLFVYLFNFVFTTRLVFYKPITHSQILLQKYKFLCPDSRFISVSFSFFPWTHPSWSPLSSWFSFSYLSTLHLSNFSSIITLYCNCISVTPTTLSSLGTVSLIYLVFLIVPNTIWTLSYRLNFYIYSEIYKILWILCKRDFHIYLYS